MAAMLQTGIRHYALGVTPIGVSVQKKARARNLVTLPPHIIIQDDGVTIEHYYYGSGEHGPPHVHVSGNGLHTKIGQNGKPLHGAAELSPEQASVIRANIRTIRRTVRKIGQWY